MNTRNITLAIAMGLLFAKGVFAIDPKTNKDEFDINSIVWIEEEVEIDLGFNPVDYLPEGFDPYAYPQHVDGFNYIDENDMVELDFDTADYLPEGFDPFVKATE